MNMEIQYSRIYRIHQQPLDKWCDTGTWTNRPRELINPEIDPRIHWNLVYDKCAILNHIPDKG